MDARQNSAGKQLAQILSYIFHPSIIPVLGAYIILKTEMIYLPMAFTLRILLLILTGTYILPLVTSLLLWRLGYLDSLHMRKAEERRIPYIIAVFFFYFTAHLLKTIHQLPVLHLFILAATVTVFIQLLFLKKQKISAHAAGLAGLSTLLIYLSANGMVAGNIWIPVALICCSLVGWARIYLDAHSVSEVFNGYLVGSIPLITLLLM